MTERKIREKYARVEETMFQSLVEESKAEDEEGRASG